jgi:hypothetical protein
MDALRCEEALRNAARADGLGGDTACSQTPARTIRRPRESWIARADLPFRPRGSTADLGQFIKSLEFYGQAAALGLQVDEPRHHRYTKKWVM